MPRETTVLMAARTERTVPVADSRPISTQAPLLAQNSTNSNRVKVSYLVREGDTLSSIAKVFRTTVASLQTWNKIQGSFIAAGDRLTIYSRARSPGRLIRLRESDSIVRLVRRRLRSAPNRSSH